MNADNAAIGSLLFGKDIGGTIGGLFGSDDKDQEYRRQKEFATQGITWKVEDAKRAGIHPLYALGAPTTSYAPQSVGGSDYGSMSGMGQDISRAIDSTATEPQRLTAYTQKLQALNLQGLELDNALKLANLRNSQQAANPPFPGGKYLMDGQTQSGPAGFHDKSFGRTPAAAGKPNQEGFAITDTGWARTSTGGLTPVPSNDVKQRIEDQAIPELMWALRNNLMPTFSAEGARDAAPPRSALPKGATDWFFDPFLQEYKPIGGKFGKPRGYNPLNW